ncbi:MAG: adenylyl-sulfate kinase [Tuberibacillus sp.]
MSDSSDKKYIKWHDGKVTKRDRQTKYGHKSMALWFTGLSGSGKSTIASEVEKVLFENGMHTYFLDGDNVRHGLNKNLGFSPGDRKENLRRVGEVAKLFVDAGIVTLAAFISPYREDREMIRAMFDEGEFLEIYVKCSVEECINRDPKGLYKLAQQGVIKEFTGINAPYEVPLTPDLVIDTTVTPLDQAVRKVLLGVRPPLL